MTFTEPMIGTFDLSPLSIPSDRSILFYGVPAVIDFVGIGEKPRQVVLRRKSVTVIL